MPSPLAAKRSVAPLASSAQDADANAANTDAPGDSDHAVAGDDGARPPNAACEVDSDDDGEDSEDDSEEDDEEETRLGPIERIKQHLKEQQQRWMDARRDPILEWKEERKWTKEHEGYRVAAEEMRRKEEARVEEKRAKKERKEKRRAQQQLTKQKEREFRETLYQYEQDVIKSETRAQLIVRFARETHIKQHKDTGAALEARKMEEERLRLVELETAVMQGRLKQQELEERLLKSIDAADELGRRYGILPAINTPPAKVLAEQDETSSVLVLRVNHANESPPPTAGSPAKPFASPPLAGKRLFFTVNMKRFKHVEEIRGEAIGDHGGIELARSLLTGACPRVKSIYLGWNHIKHSAIVALADSFVRGACGQLALLDLRCNSIDAVCMNHILGALDQGGLPELRELILQGNMLGDEGAKALAHAMLRGTLKLLRVIDVRQNRIRNSGILALWNVFTSECTTKCCPKLQLLDMRRNEAQGSLTRSFCPCPPYLEF